MPRALFALLALAAASPISAAPRSTAPTPLSASLIGDERIAHALNRLGFGPRPGDVERVRAKGLGAWIDEQLHPERLDDSALEVELKKLPLLYATPSALLVAHEYDQSNAIKLLLALGAGRENISPAQKARARLARLNRRNATSGEMGTMEMPATPAKPGTATFNSLPPREQERARAIAQRASAAGIERGDSARALGQLVSAKITRAANSKKQLQEVLVDFWGNHFNLDVRKGVVRTLKVADDRNVIRPHVLGSFRALLGASAHSPAMLFYLDNVRSVASQSAQGARFGRRARLRQAAPRRAGGVNENYARELMELHTLGVNGGYTQKDVQEVARCFTGWSLDRETGEFRFNARAHDSGPKVVLGQSISAGGMRDGEQVLDILASHPSTARFLSRKLCVRLVGDEPPQVLVDRVAKKWIATKGDLRAVVAEIAYAPEFYGRQAARSKIKSPFEFAISAVRALDAQVSLPDARSEYGAARLHMDGQSLLYAGGRRGNRDGLRPSMSQMIAQMGQPLFAFQAPTGYAEDSRRWVSSGALIARLNFALALSQGQIAHVQAPPRPIFEGLSGDDHQAVLKRLDERLLNNTMTPATRATLMKQLKPGTPADPVKLTALVLGAPEFQRR